MQTEELIGEFSHERNRFENPTGATVIGVVVAKDGGAVTVKGSEPAGDGFVPGQTYRFFGRWSEYENKYRRKKEKQFAFSLVADTSPITEAGTKLYLQKFKGISKGIANKLWRAFGDGVLDMIREAPWEVSQGEDLDDDLIDRISDILWETKDKEQATIDLLELFAGKGFPKKTIDRCIDEWGGNAANVIRRDPFKLLQFPGVGFRRVDALYVSMHLPEGKLRRQGYCAMHGVDLQCSESGSTWVDAAHARCMVKGLIGEKLARPEKAVRFGIRAGLMTQQRSDGEKPHWDGDEVYLSSRMKAQREQKLGEYILDAMAEPPYADIPEPASELSRHQSAAVLKLRKSWGCIRILGGGPGTGKTFVLSHIVKGLLQEAGKDSIALAAPTGKAAVRITESLAAAGIRLRATTWHSLLGFNPGGGFRYNEKNPLPHIVIIGDEMSMQDTDMACRAFAARRKGCLFFLIGDIHQLPPVGHGAPLRDMIRSGVPYAELHEVRRNSGEIVTQCHKMRAEEKIDFSGGGNLSHVPASTEDETMTETIRLVKEMEDPVWGCQVLVPTNKMRKEANKVLQSQISTGPEIKGSPFRISDKVVCLKNGWLKPIECSPEAICHEASGNVYVANGELGCVVKADDKRLVIKVSDPYRLVSVFRRPVHENGDPDDRDSYVKREEESATGCDWDLAYALSVHKAQGSEAPQVIVMMDKSGGARRICSREWLYTAISRAKEHCYVVGPEHIAHDMVSVTKVHDRKTFLAERIQSGERGLPLHGLD